MKIGDNVYVHGYVDEIRKDTVIIRNKGGYFGTVRSEIICGEMRKGHWIPMTCRYEPGAEGFPYLIKKWTEATEQDNIEGLKCSECGEIFDFEDARKWCCECGARMEGEG